METAGNKEGQDYRNQPCGMNDHGSLCPTLDRTLTDLAAEEPTGGTPLYTL